MKVITIANQKGGTGKTTTTLCLGAELEQKGYKVLYIDLDKQSNTTSTLKADREQKGAYELLAEQAGANDLIQITEDGHHVISSNNRLDNVNKILNDEKNQNGKEFRLKNGLTEVKDKYDFVVIDTAPDLNTVTINALTATDYLIIVALADSYSLDGISALCGIADVIKQYTNKDLKKGGVLLTRYSDRSIINRAYKDEIKATAETYGTKMFNTCIRETVTIRESQALKQPITEYAPKSNANQDYLTFTDEVLEDIEG